MDLKKLISVAKGEAPADLIVKNARIVNTFIGSIEFSNVAICGDRIAGVGDYEEGRTIHWNMGGHYAGSNIWTEEVKQLFINCVSYARSVSK